MLNAFAGGHPLHISVAVSAGSAEAIGMINKAFSDHRYGFETTVWMSGKTRDGGAMVHPKTVLNDEVLAHMTALKMLGIWPQLRVSLWEKIFVVDAKQKRI
jgi:hypothetical protein